jgi:hypothetical protein
MASNALSNSRFIVEELITTRGQLGQGYSSTFAANITLWTDVPQANKYMLSPTVAALSVTLPTVGQATAEAQPGHHIYIYNYSTTNAFTILDNNAAPFLLSPESGALYVADTAIAPGNWHEILNSSSYNTATSLQQAYNRSVLLGDDPKILIDSTKSPVTIRDSIFAPGAPVIFQIQDHTGAVPILTVGNSSSYKKVVSLFNGSYTNNCSDSFIVKGSANNSNSAVFYGTLDGADSFVYRGTVEGDNVVCFSTSTDFDITNVSDRQVERNSGKVQYGGDVILGSVSNISSPMKNKQWISFTANPSTYTANNLFNPMLYQSYLLKIKVSGIDTASPWTTGGAVTISARVTGQAGTPQISIDSVLISSTPGFTTPLDATVLYSGGIVLSLRAPSNCTLMAIRGYYSYVALSIP